MKLGVRSVGLPYSIELRISEASFFIELSKNIVINQRLKLAVANFYLLFHRNAKLCQRKICAVLYCLPFCISRMSLRLDVCSSIQVLVM